MDVTIILMQYTFLLHLHSIRCKVVEVGEMPLSKENKIETEYHGNTNSCSPSILVNTANVEEGKRCDTTIITVAPLFIRSQPNYIQVDILLLTSSPLIQPKFGFHHFL